MKRSRERPRHLAARGTPTLRCGKSSYTSDELDFSVTLLVSDGFIKALRLKKLLKVQKAESRNKSLPYYHITANKSRIS